MKEVYHSKSLSMAFCLECHRRPQDALRPMAEVTNLSWVHPSAPNDESTSANPHADLGIKDKWGVHPPLSCTGCHR
jgi:hypothetical protein